MIGRFLGSNWEARLVNAYFEDNGVTEYQDLSGYYNLSIPHICQSCRLLVIDNSFVDTDLDLGYTETLLHRMHSRHLQID